LYLIGAHVFLIVLGFAGQDQIPLYKKMWQFLTLYDWMWFALAGFVLMVLAGCNKIQCWWFGCDNCAGNASSSNYCACDEFKNKY
jgi:hypothetical protein